jgi:hypothetical protein
VLDSSTLLCNQLPKAPSLLLSKRECIFFVIFFFSQCPKLFSEQSHFSAIKALLILRSVFDISSNLFIQFYAVPFPIQPRIFNKNGFQLSNYSDYRTLFVASLEFCHGYDFSFDIIHCTHAATTASFLQRFSLRWAFQCVFAGMSPLSAYVGPRQTQQDNLPFCCFRHQGGGFSGFWFHLGYLHSIHPNDLHSFDYYCFSAGCLSTYSFGIASYLECVFNIYVSNPCPCSIRLRTHRHSVSLHEQVSRPSFGGCFFRPEGLGQWQSKPF